MSNNIILGQLLEASIYVSEDDSNNKFQKFCYSLCEKICATKNESKITEFDISDYLETSILYQAVLKAGEKSGYLKAQDHKKTADIDGKKNDLKLAVIDKEKFPTNEQIMTEVTKIISNLKNQLEHYKKSNTTDDISICAAIEKTITDLETDYMQQSRASTRINKIQSYIDNDRNTKLVINQQSYAGILFGEILDAIGTACSFLLPDEWNKSESEKLLSGAGSSTGILAITAYESTLVDTFKEELHEAVDQLKILFQDDHRASKDLNIDAAAKRNDTLSKGFSQSDMLKKEDKKSN
jgi:hypothetical protein